MFTEEDLLEAAGPVVFERGVEYLRYVRGLQLRVDQATASIQAKRVYTVQLAWFGHALDGACSCPHNSDGNFCKHLVAVGLAVLDAETDPLVGDHEGEVLDSYLAGLDHASLVALVKELIAQDESAFRLVQAHAVEAGSAAVDPDELTRAVSAAMPHGLVDYRASFDAARDAQALLDNIEALLDAGAADQVRPALQRALTRLRTVMLSADDSAGVLGDACQRAAELHARACVDGEPDAVALARWLVKFRAESPGWPHLTLAMYVPALNQRALDVYRAELARQDIEHPNVEPFSRFEVDRMLLELADQDGDVDEAIRQLSRDAEHTAYGAIIARLRAAPTPTRWSGSIAGCGPAGCLTTSALGRMTIGSLPPRSPTSTEALDGPPTRSRCCGITSVGIPVPKRCGCSSTQPTLRTRRTGSAPGRWTRPNRTPRAAVTVQP